MAKRRNFSAVFNAKVALEALRGDRTLAELAAWHKVHPNLSTKWKRHAAEGMVEVFSGRPARRDGAHEAEVKELHAEIGELTVEKDRVPGTRSLSIDRDSTVLFPWRGTAATESLALALVSKGLRASPRHVVIEAGATAPEVVEALKEISRNPAPEATELAEYMQNLAREKYHSYLSRSLLALDAAAGRVAAEDVPALAQQLAGR